MSAILAIFAWLAFRVCVGPYLPSSEISDGFGYFMGAKSFYLNHRLSAPVIHLDKVSLIGEFYSHGFGYSLLNGSVALLVGWHDKLIIAINIALLAAAAIFILTRKYEWPWKLALLLLFLTFYLTPTMTFAYMQETVHLLLALVLGHLLLRIVDQEDEGRNWTLILCFYILIAASALLRPTWVFWGVGPLAIAKSKRDLSLLGALSILSVGVGYLYLKLFFAPYPYYVPYAEAFAASSDHRLLDAAYAVLEFVRQNLAKLFSNQFYIFGETYIPNAYTLVVIGVAAYLYGCYRGFGDRRALAVALIATVYVAAIFLAYDVLAGARTIAVVFVLELIYLVKSRKTTLVVTLVVAQLAIFPAVVGITGRIIGVQVSAGEYAEKNRAQLQAVRDLGSAIRIGRRATIYVDYALTNFQYPPSFHFPLRSADGHPLRYSLDTFNFRPMQEREFNSRFLDFVLAQDRLSRSDLAPVYEADHLHLYKVRDE